MEPWHRVIDIPEGQVGDYCIRYRHEEAGFTTRTSNLRTQIMGTADHEHVEIEFGFPTRWHQLKHREHGIWMTDLPIEQAQHDRELRPMEGRVLVGGLGLGYAAHVLAHRPSVWRVDVVEISPEVVELVGPHMKDPNGVVRLHTADLFDFLEAAAAGDKRWDWAFFDIWQSDGQGTFMDTVIPLRKLVAPLVPSQARVVCWNEDVMRGQFRTGLQSRYLTSVSPVFDGTDLETLATELPEDNPGAEWVNWSVPFFRSVIDCGWDEEMALDMIPVFVARLGIPGLEPWAEFVKLIPDVADKVGA